MAEKRPILEVLSWVAGITSTILSVYLWITSLKPIDDNYLEANKQPPIIQNSQKTAKSQSDKQNTLINPQNNKNDQPEMLEKSSSESTSTYYLIAGTFSDQSSAGALKAKLDVRSYITDITNTNDPFPWRVLTKRTTNGGTVFQVVTKKSYSFDKANRLKSAYANTIGVSVKLLRR